ncbi:hypothetical protein [Streptomyces sp. NPDC002328]|uniref:hypothetical protein n=1 Tax=Streptomyces sp. NPDC002328 TaxID=3364642 RepID=UPI0036C653C4
MIVSYKQDDGTVEQVTTEDLSAIEAAAIEQAMGDTPWRRVEDMLRAQDPTAMRAVLWIFRRRAQPDLEFSAFDVPGWRRRLTARLERVEIDDVLNTLVAEAISTQEDAAIDAMLPHLRKLAASQDDVDAALGELGKAHLIRSGRASAT